MVRFRYLFQIYCGCLALACAKLSASPIQSIRLASESVVHTKPCEPVFALLEITVSPETDLQEIMRVPRDLAAHVTIDSRDYDVEFNSTGLNPVASFSLHKDKFKRVDGKIVSCQVVAILLWNYLSDTCVFIKPGVHNVEFHPGVQWEVVVETPTEAESELISRLQALGVEFPAFVLDPHDSKWSKNMAPRIDKLLQDYSDTSHAAFLSVSVGVSLLPYPRTDQERRDFDFIEFLHKRVAFVEKYFEPFCVGEIDSIFESVAAYYAATESMKLLRHDPAVPDAKRHAMQEKAITRLEQVRDSPYSLSFARDASDFLRQMADREARGAAQNRDSRR